MQTDPAQALLAAAHVVGPVLLFGASCAFLAGMEGWQGVLGFYGTAVLAPVLLLLPLRFADVLPRYALLCHVVAVFGCAAACFDMAMRPTYTALARAGLVTGSLDEAFLPMLMSAQNPEMLAIGGTALAFPLTLVFEGIGVWRAVPEPSTTGPLLVASGLLFALAQWVPMAEPITYPASCVCLLGALVPLAWPDLRG